MEKGLPTSTESISLEKIIFKNNKIFGFSLSNKINQRETEKITNQRRGKNPTKLRIKFIVREMRRETANTVGNRTPASMKSSAPIVIDSEGEQLAKNLQHQIGPIPDTKCHKG
jgi:hypothetical protein